MMKYKNRGLTLIELLVAVGFGLVLLTSGAGFYFNVKKQQTIAFKKEVLSQQLRIALYIYNNIVSNTGLSYCDNAEIDPTEISITRLPFSMPMFGNSDEKGYFKYMTTVENWPAVKNVDIRVGLSDAGLERYKTKTNVEGKSAQDIGGGLATKRAYKCADYEQDYFETNYKITSDKDAGMSLMNHLVHQGGADIRQPQFYLHSKNIKLMMADAADRDSDRLDRSAQWDDDFYLADDASRSTESNHPRGADTLRYKVTPYLMRSMGVVGRATDPDAKKDIEEMEVYSSPLFRNVLLFPDGRTRKTVDFKLILQDETI